MPTVWVGKMLQMMRVSAVKGCPHFFIGSKEGVAKLLKERIER
jgi:hypothetical protein